MARVRANQSFEANASLRFGSNFLSKTKRIVPAFFSLRDGPALVKGVIRVMLMHHELVLRLDVTANVVRLERFGITN